MRKAFKRLAAVVVGVGVVLALMLGLYWILFVLPLVAFLGGALAYGLMAPGAAEGRTLKPGNAPGQNDGRGQKA